MPLTGLKNPLEIPGNRKVNHGLLQFERPTAGIESMGSKSKQRLKQRDQKIPTFWG